MAIKVNGTTVVNDSRSLTNIASIDATTEAAISAAGFSQTTGDITGVTAGSGISGGGSSGTVTISHADTSSQGSINNSGNTVIQDISVDTYGHITSMSSATISSSPPTTAGAVGTYMFAMRNNTANVSFGTTVAGSALAPTTAARSVYYMGQNYSYIGFNQGSYQSGTWRCMGQFDFQAANGLEQINGATLWVRIS